MAFFAQIFRDDLPETRRELFVFLCPSQHERPRQDFAARLEGAGLFLLLFGKPLFLLGEEGFFLFDLLFQPFDFRKGLSGFCIVIPGLENNPILRLYS